MRRVLHECFFFFFQAEDGIRDHCVTGVQTCALPICRAAEGRPIYKQMIQHQREAFGKGVKAGVKIAFGTDAGGFAWDVNEAVEVKRMVDAGMTPMQAIKASTSVAAELLGTKRKIREISAGALADLVAVQGG